jgi:hypothetical protein
MDASLRWHDRVVQAFSVTPAKAGVHAESGSSAASKACLHDMREEVVPARIGLFDQPRLPSPLPRLDRLLARDRLVDAVEMLAIDEPCQPVFSAELGALSSPMLDNARGKVARHADVKRAVRAVCHNVHPAASHSSVLADVQHGCQPTLA